MTSKNPRNLFFHFRCTKPEIEAIQKNARRAGLRPSAFARAMSVSNGDAKLACRVDEEAIFELRRLGAMLKSLYPKNANWTNEEKRRYWDAMNSILRHADSLESSK